MLRVGVGLPGAVEIQYCDVPDTHVPGVNITLVLWGCSDAQNFEIIGSSCPNDSGPVESSRQSLELEDLGGGSISVTHRCASVDPYADSGDFRVDMELTDSEIVLSYEINGGKCDAGWLPSDLFYELQGISAGDWTVTVDGISGQVTVQ